MVLWVPSNLPRRRSSNSLQRKDKPTSQLVELTKSKESRKLWRSDELKTHEKVTTKAFRATRSPVLLRALSRSSAPSSRTNSPREKKNCTPRPLRLTKLKESKKDWRNAPSRSKLPLHNRQSCRKILRAKYPKGKLAFHASVTRAHSSIEISQGISRCQRCLMRMADPLRLITSLSIPS